MRLHVVRHAETDENRLGIIQGDLVDGGLNALGRDQARALARHFSDLPLTRILTSPMLRARETAQAIADATGAEPIALWGLREISWGDYNGRRSEGAVKEDMEAILRAWDAGDLARHAPGGETPAQAWERAARDLLPALDALRGDVAVVAHGRINKILLSGLVHGDVGHMEAFPQRNAGVTVLEREGARWVVRHLNLGAHLGVVPSHEERQS